jgi:hypothetical protein
LQYHGGIGDMVRLCRQIFGLRKNSSKHNVDNEEKKYRNCDQAKLSDNVQLTICFNH